MTTRRAAIAGGAGAAILAALGYRAWDRGVFSAGSGPAYVPWTEWQGAASEGPRRPLHAAILAANPHDTQPWLFAVDGDTITVFADRARNLGSFDPYRREMHLGLGCAIENVVLAAFAQGRATKVNAAIGRLTLSPSNTQIEAARISIGKQGTTICDVEPICSLPRLLYNAIPNRHTNRGAYRPDRAIQPDLLAQLSDGFSMGSARIALITDAGARRELGDIVVEATQCIIADKEMSDDSAHWFRTGAGEIAAHRDGVTMDTAGLSPLTLFAAKLLPDMSAKTADEGWLAMTRDTQIPTAPVLGLIFVNDRLDMAQAIAAGRAWQRFHLGATTHGLAAQPMNQPVEIVDRDAMLGRANPYARALAKLSHVANAEATFVFRLGYAERPALPSPRRPLSDVLKA